jgi:hypothetical protein
MPFVPSAVSVSVKLQFTVLLPMFEQKMLPPSFR